MEGFQRAGCWTQRNGDNMTTRPGGITIPLNSPPDLMVCSTGWNALIECKATTLGTIPLNKVRDHQHDALAAFTKIGPEHHAFVALNYCNLKLGKARVNRAWLIPFSVWSTYEQDHQRKSIRLDWLEWNGAEWAIAWVPGAGWLIP